MGLWKPPFGAQIQRGHPDAEGLIGCWLMNEGAGSKVANLARPGWHDGALTGSTCEWTTGANGRAIQITGDNVSDRVDLGAVPTTDVFSGVNGVLSISVLVYKVADADMNNVFPRIIDKSDAGAGSNGWHLYYWLNNYFELQAVGGTLVAKSSRYSAAGWYHVVAVFEEGGVTKMYINGVDDTVASNAFVFDHDTETNMAIGNWNHSTDRQWNGQIAYVMAYDRVLTADRVARQFRDPYAMLRRPSKSYLFLGGGAPPAGTILSQMLQHGLYAGSLT